MARRHEDDAPNYTADAQESEEDATDAEVVPEHGEGPIPPLAGDPRPPIGN